MNANSVYEAFTEAARAFGARPFLRAPASSTRLYAAGAVGWTYAEAAAEVERLQTRYAGQGLQPDLRVAVAFDSRVDVYLHLLALNGLGVSLVPLNMGGTDHEIARLIEHSDCTLAVAAELHAPRLRALPGQPAACRILSQVEFDAGAAADPVTVAGVAAREAALLYTSGTTGHPKGCMLANEYFLAMGRWYNNLDGRYALTSRDRVLTPLPPHHMNALCTSFMGALMCGGCVVQLDRFHPSSWWQTVREEQATVIHYLGVMPAILLTLPPTDDDDVGDQVRFGFGAGCDPRHHGLFEQRFGFPLLEAWSMTETGAGGVTIADKEPRHVGRRCIGRPSRAIEYRIVDEHGTEVVRGEPGELQVRAGGAAPRKGFFSGYYKDEQATEAAWAGGWFHTGDVIRVGEDGSLYFVDRQKNIIRRSGENIAAVEVEAALLAHPAVRNCAVTAVPDELRGEEVFAFVIPRERGTGNDAAALVRHCLERLSYFKAPGYVAFVDELPVTASQKVNRAEVKMEARRRLEAGACIDLRNAKKRPRAKAG
ncbi:MAG TPA: AMP-binding protein [Woeseiaceae bacterium]|nr:AMP-binding protein [Woeseiaceae bacterium]